MPDSTSIEPEGLKEELWRCPVHGVLEPHKLSRGWGTGGPGEYGTCPVMLDEDTGCGEVLEPPIARSKPEESGLREAQAEVRRFLIAKYGGVGEPRRPAGFSDDPAAKRLHDAVLLDTSIEDREPEEQQRVESETFGATLDPRQRGVLREAMVLAFVEGTVHAGALFSITPEDYPKDSAVVERVLRSASRSVADIYPALAALADHLDNDSGTVKKQPAPDQCPRCGSTDPAKLAEACARDGVPTDNWHVESLEALGRGPSTQPPVPVPSNGPGMVGKDGERVPSGASGEGFCTFDEEEGPLGPDGEPLAWPDVVYVEREPDGSLSACIVANLDEPPQLPDRLEVCRYFPTDRVPAESEGER